MLKKFTLSLAIIGTLFIAYWQYQNIGSEKKISTEIKALDGKIVRFETNKGNFEITLSAKVAPKTVLNFVEYVRAGFYNGTIFHRMISGVIIQGGGFESEMKMKETRTVIVNESNNSLSNLVGSIAMARKGEPDSATSQFFINLRDNKKLDYQDGLPGYTVFGQVSKGLELLKKLSASETITVGIHQNIPKDEIKILSVHLVSELKEIVKEAAKENESVKTETKKIEFVEGVHYQLLENPLKLTATNKVEIISAFSYGCGHCYGAYAQIEAWKKAHLKEVEFSYFHAVWNKAMRLYAKTYYTAIELGVEKQTHVPLFEAIVINQETLSTKDEIAEFLSKVGVDKNQFIETFDSERIEKRVIQAEKLTKAFNLASVPEFIVAGKYRVEPMRAGGQNEMFELLEYLVKKEIKK